MWDTELSLEDHRRFKFILYLLLKNISSVFLAQIVVHTFSLRAVHDLMSLLVVITKNKKTT